MREKFIKWLKRNYWTPLDKSTLTAWDAERKCFFNKEVNSMYSAWKAGRRSK